MKYGSEFVNPATVDVLIRESVVELEWPREMTRWGLALRSAARSAPVQVAVAILRDERGRVLISRRQAGTHLAGLWEFPGGKLDPGETTADALKREIREELGIEVVSHRPLITVLHNYAEKTVLLDTHLVVEWRGEARGMEGQRIEWVDEHLLSDYSLPEADRPLLKALTLPDRYLITPPAYESRADFLFRLEAALEAGIRLLQLRLPGVSQDELYAVSIRAKELCDRYAASLMVKDARLADSLGCGLHMTSVDLKKCSSRPLASRHLVAASCHTASEMVKAESLDLDFVTLSPVLPTASHETAIPLGWGEFSKLVSRSGVPVFALGGLSENDLADAWVSGAQGVAAIRGYWPETRDFFPSG